MEAPRLPRAAAAASAAVSTQAATKAKAAGWCVEAARGASLAAHAASGLASDAGARQAARLLRAAEALARSAVAALLAPGEGAEAVHPARAAVPAEEQRHGGGKSRSAKRRKRRRAAAQGGETGISDSVQQRSMVVDDGRGGGVAAGGVSTVTLADGSVMVGDLSEFGVGPGDERPGYLGATDSASVGGTSSATAATDLQEVWRRAVEQGPETARLLEQVFLSKGIGKGGVGIRAPRQRRRDK